MLAPAIISVLPYVPLPPHDRYHAKGFDAVITVLKQERYPPEANT